MYFDQKTAEQILAAPNFATFEKLEEKLKNFFKQKLAEKINVSEKHIALISSYYTKESYGDATISLEGGSSILGHQEANRLLSEYRKTDWKNNKPLKIRITDEKDKRIFNLIKRFYSINSSLINSFDFENHKHNPQQLLKQLEQYIDLMKEIMGNEKVIFEIKNIVHEYIQENELTREVEGAKTIEFRPPYKK